MCDRRRNRSGRKLLIAVALGPICAAAADLPVREVTSQATRVANIPNPGFQRGYMYFLDRDTVRLYAPQGDPAFVRVLNIPSCATSWAMGLAIDSDGSVAIAVSCDNAQSGGIVLLDQNGLDTAFINTGRWLPSNLCYGEDHSLWSFGYQHDAANPGKMDSQDYMMVRHYSADHKETGRYLARSLFPKGLEPGMPGQWHSRIMLSHEKVGLLAYAGELGSSVEWVELDLNGNLLRRVPITVHGVAEFAFTTGGRLYWKKSQRSDQLLVLNTTTPDWLDAGPSPLFHLIGADGDLLVYSKGGEGPVDLHWFAQPTSKGP